MKIRVLLVLLPILVLLGTSYASQTYCSDLFGNVHGIVSNDVYTLGTFNELIALTGLIIISVIVFMSFIYGIGIAFGINSFKAFAKTEFLESLVNLLILAFVVGGIFSANGFTSFFSNISASTIPTSSSTISSSTPSLTTSNGQGIEALYLNTCNNIVNVQMLSGIAIMFGTYMELVGYQLLSGLSISFSFTGKNSVSLGSLLPDVGLMPFAGLGITQGFIYNEFSALSGFIGVSIATVLLLFVIYFLFPILFYVGVLFRSFPWTRAAGGSLIALFIAFFIIFPSILSVFTFSTASNILSGITQLCGSALASGSSSSDVSAATNNLCITSSSSNGNIISFAQKFGIDSLSSGSAGSFLLGFLFGNGFGLNANISLYSEEMSFYILMLTGLFISFTISYDLLGVLSKLLGSPSFDGKKIFGKII